MKFLVTAEGTALESQAGFLRRDVEQVVLRGTGIELIVTGTPDRLHLGKKYIVKIRPATAEEEDPDDCSEGAQNLQCKEK